MKTITRKEAKAQGMRRYFTGKPCKHGHVAERFVGDRKCLECEWGRKRQYCAENREYFRQYSRRWREENRDKELERKRQYREENRERMIEYSRQHYAENRELYAAHFAKRRAAKIDRTLSHDEELTQFVMGEAAQQARDMEELFGTPFHVDHMIPMQGEEVSGLHVYYNLQVIPAHLNIGKGNRMRYTQPLEWLADSA